MGNDLVLGIFGTANRTTAIIGKSDGTLIRENAVIDAPLSPSVADSSIINQTIKKLIENVTNKNISKINSISKIFVCSSGAGGEFSKELIKNTFLF